MVRPGKPDLKRRNDRDQDDSDVWRAFGRDQVQLYPSEACNIIFPMDGQPTLSLSTLPLVQVLLPCLQYIVQNPNKLLDLF